MLSPAINEATSNIHVNPTRRKNFKYIITLEEELNEDIKDILSNFKELVCKFASFIQVP